MAEEIEKIYIIPLKKAGYKSSKAAPTAVKRVKSYLTRHMKVEEQNIWIDDSLNNALWSKGKYDMPTKIRVKAVKFDDGVVEAYLPELEFKKSRRELLKEEREKKEPILRKDEMGAEELEGEESGTEDYEMVPTADGDVKLKKKKTTKDKEDKEKPDEKKETIKQETKKPVKKKETKKEDKKPAKKEKSEEPKKTDKKKPAKKTASSKKTSTKKKTDAKK
jgi:large subunit ribosomal protein L31e